jgi:hypothetical protein
VRVIHNLTEVQEDAIIWIPSGNLKVLNPGELSALNEFKVAFGPNIDWFNLDNLDVIKKISSAQCIAPSQWVVPIIQEKVGTATKVFVWAAGVDLDFWKPKSNERDMVLIYLKSQISDKTIAKLKYYLDCLGHSSTVVEYGDYSPSEFKKILDKCFSAVWIGDTESQGIALLETWAMNVPTLVLPRNSWESPEGKMYSASAAPYLEESLGRFFTSKDVAFSEVERFITDCLLGKFEPRKTISLKYSAIGQTIALVNSIDR